MRQIEITLEFRGKAWQKVKPKDARDNDINGKGTRREPPYFISTHVYPAVSSLDRVTTSDRVRQHILKCKVLHSFP
jgi:hypothetical protein